MGAVYTKTYKAPQYREREILRYAGVREKTAEIESLMRECIAELGDRLCFKVCYTELGACVVGNDVDLGFCKVCSAALAKNLRGCDRIVLMGATVGLEIDRLIARYGTLSPSRALMMQAIGAERIESLCDSFCEEIKEEKRLLGKSVRPRFSPGYGDLPIELQRDIFLALDCPRRIGLSLNESLLMSPSKSVTAIIGVGSGACTDGNKLGCDVCENKGCGYRK